MCFRPLRLTGCSISGFAVDRQPLLRFYWNPASGQMSDRVCDEFTVLSNCNSRMARFFQ